GRGGPFRSLDDWAARVEPRALNRRQMEALAAAGAFDCLAPAREKVFRGAEALLAAAQAAARERAEGQGGLFAASSGAAMQVLLPEGEPWRLGERLAHEREAFGFYVSGHPVEEHPMVLAANAVVSSLELLARPARRAGSRETVAMAGLVEELVWRTPQGQGPDRRFLIADFSDSGGSFSATCFDSGLFPVLRDAGESGAPLLLSMEIQWREDGAPPRMTIVRAEPMELVARAARLRLSIRLVPDCDPQPLLDRLRALPRDGQAEIEVAVPTLGGMATVRLGRFFRCETGLAEWLRADPAVADLCFEPLTAPLRLVA
ncbi:MAG: DNA polymerase III subunit alpha, partial [Sphingomonadaceae bacterium]